MNITKNLPIYNKLKVLVTGSTGFKGSWLSFCLNSLNSNVIGLGLQPEKNSILFESLKLKKSIKQYICDIRNFNKLNQVIKKEKPDIVFHLAAQSIVSSSFKDPHETFDINVNGSLNLLESCRINNIKNIVFITSDKCYQNNEWIWSYRENDLIKGDDPYSASKSAAEIIFNSYYKSFFNNNKYIKYASARAGNVIGGGDMKKDRIIPDLIRFLNSKKNIQIRNPQSTRPWQHVLEPIYGYLLLGDRLLNCKLEKKIMPNWNFGPNAENCKKVIEVSKLVKKYWGEKEKKIIIKSNKSFKESNLLMLCNDKAKIELNWKPKLSIEESIKLTVEWYKAYYTKKNMLEFTDQQLNYFFK